MQQLAQGFRTEQELRTDVLQAQGREMDACPDVFGVTPLREAAFDQDIFGDVQPDEGELGWQERALCAQTDPEAFFPEKGGSTREAKKVCVSCGVRSQCLEYALENDERFGIWGGLSERERRRLKRYAV